MSVKGAKRHSHRLKAMMGPDLQRGLVRAAVGIAETAKELIVDGYGVPSQPGQAPHSQTGELRASIVAEPSGENGATITAKKPGSAFVEFGRGGRQAPRPFMQPAVERNLSNVAKEIAAEVNIKLRRV